MSTKTFKTRIQLRKDLESNYAPIKDSFVPLKGEVLLVDTASDGLRSKVGDGVSTFAQLSYTDQVLRDQISGIVVKGYYFQGAFYSDITHTITIVPYEYKVYIDLSDSKYDIYIYNGSAYYRAVELPTATSTNAGIMKLYDAVGENTDGTMTQKSITEEISKRFVVSVNEDDGSIEFKKGIISL